MVEPFTTFTSRTFVLPQESIDTDQIIPARFLTTTSRAGLGDFAFYDWRYDAQGKTKRDAPLNQVDTQTCSVLVAGDNFGCGSSREHAPWALRDFGVRAVVSTSIADIFTSNALKNGLLPIVVDQATHERLLADPGGRVTINLEECTLSAGNEPPVRFEVEPFARRCLLDGVDALGHLLSHTAAIEAFEHAHGLEPRHD
ncbi:MAG TPA: 3-isopropylmalate dehydratase small subunit [Vitreimonas sp.]|jgi:3-isopropylmalate/(R)-2-methylmalate dehydratase small subunit|nr:3-isopropylmalate dehydratase small subunit [Vitreimonas sp.]